MEQKRGQEKSSVLQTKEKNPIVLTIILILLVAIFIFLIFLLFKYLPGAPKELNVTLSKPFNTTINLSYAVKQFYPNMKFNSNSIYYKIATDCNSEKKQRMLEAFNEFETEVGIIKFYETQEDEDIKI